MKSEIPASRVEPWQPAQEIQVRIRPFYSLGMTSVVMLRISIGAFVLLGFLALLLHGNIGPVGNSIAILILGYLFLPAILFMAMVRREYDAVLRFETKIIAVKTKTSWNALTVPSELQMEGPLTIILKLGLAKRKFLFRSSTDATTAAQLIKERFPTLRETNIEPRS